MQINRKNISTRSNTISRMRVPYGYREVNVDRSASELLEKLSEYRHRLAASQKDFVPQLTEAEGESVLRIRVGQQELLDKLYATGYACGLDMQKHDVDEFIKNSNAIHLMRLSFWLIHQNLYGNSYRGDGQEIMTLDAMEGVEDVIKALEPTLQNDTDRIQIIKDAVFVVAHACKYDRASAVDTHGEMSDVLKQLQTMYGPPKTEIELEKIFEYYEPKLKETITEAAAELQRQEAAAQAKAEAAEKAKIAEEKARIAEEKRLERNRKRREARARKKAAAQQAAKAANQPAQTTTTSTALKVSGGHKEVDLTGFTVTPAGLTPQEVVAKLVEKHGEVRNVYEQDDKGKFVLDAQGNPKIIPNRLVAVGTVPAIESWNKKKMGSGFTKRIYEVITTVNLIWQSSRLQELLNAEPKLRGIVGLCAPKDARLIGNSLKKEFYGPDSNYIVWFFTGCPWANRNDANIKGPIDLKPGDIPSNGTDFANWNIGRDDLSRYHADSSDNYGAFVVQAQW